MAITDAKKFTGTLGSAKEITAWAGESRACFGATLGYTDGMEGGLNLIEERNGAPFYHTVYPDQWVAKTDANEILLFDEAQMRAVFPQAFS
jgi:hypothetical protein